jgi:hypothetical protein
MIKKKVKKLLEFYSYTKQISELDRNNYPKLDLEKILEKKKSDTIFILGSSPSILSIQSDAWKEISQHDSFALNTFAFHDHIPTYYSFEFSNQLAITHFLFSEISEKYLEKDETIFFLNFPNFKYSGIKYESISKVFDKNHMFIMPRFTLDSNSKYIRKVCKRLHVEKEQGKLDYRSFFHIRASVPTCVQICWALGYKNICLPGVDLKNQHYFFQEIDSYNAQELTRLFEIETSYTTRTLDVKRFHRTESDLVSNESDTLPVSQILRILQNELLSLSGSQIYAYSSESKLSSYFPIWSGVST